MAHKTLNDAKIEFFAFKNVNDNQTYVVPNSVTEGTDTITFTSRWDAVALQGGTQALTAFNAVENPQVQINLKFSEDLCREFSNICSEYQTLVNAFAKIQYPKNNAGGNIKPPYCRISWDGRVYRGYFTNIRITLNGPYKIHNKVKNKYRSHCEITAQFIIAPASGIKESNINVINANLL